MTTSRKKPKKIIVAVSGGFDPIHPGHVRLFNRAKKLGDELVVILNNDNWLKAKKIVPFMSGKERKEVIEAMRAVDRVILTGHKPNPTDMSVSAELKKLKPTIFANGGDRKKGNVPEDIVCETYGIKMVYNVGHGGKVESSSWLLANYVDNHKKHVKKVKQKKPSV